MGRHSSVARLTELYVASVVTLRYKVRSIGSNQRVGSNRSAREGLGSALNVRHCGPWPGFRAHGPPKSRFPSVPVRIPPDEMIDRQRHGCNIANFRNYSTSST